MVTALDRYRESSKRRRRRAERANYRLDLQGLRAVAVLVVFATHLTGWPRGGFVGIDIFFVISGFFVTDMLLRSAGSTGTVSLGRFWLDRARRILPAATAVLVVTAVASVFLLPHRARDIGIDALFSFVFLANWRFAAQGADTSAAIGSASPVQHYWPLSIEEQFYLVWPVIIVAITAIVVRRAWSRDRWLVLVAAVSGLLAAVSLSWATYETADSPRWAYFNTSARIWELGVGALLATAVGVLARTPEMLRPVLSWAGVALIIASLVLISPASGGIPAPWALLPVAGAALVVAAGVGSEPMLQGLLRNRAATYLGDLSYSLYLVHWPVIVLLGPIMHRGVYYYAGVLALSFGLAIACHHFLEGPLRQANWAAIRSARHDMKHGLYHVERSTKIAAVAALVLITLSVIAYAAQPERYEPKAPAGQCCGHAQ